MKHSRLITLLFILITSNSFAQYVLETPDGRQVELKSNGTWTYVKAESKAVKSNTVSLASGKYVDKFGKFAITYDPKQWVCDTISGESISEWDANFRSTDMAVFGYFMSSRLSMPTENLETRIREQWANSGAITSLTFSKNNINGLVVTIYDMTLSYEDNEYQYLGYVHSTPKGSFQFVVGTQKEVFIEDIQKIQKLLQSVRQL